MYILCWILKHYSFSCGFVTLLEPSKDLKSLLVDLWVYLGGFEKSKKILISLFCAGIKSEHNRHMFFYTSFLLVLQVFGFR